jgi:hypothetical protein
MVSGQVHCTQWGTALPSDAQFCASRGARTMQAVSPTWSATALNYQPEPLKYGGFSLR